MVKAVGKGVIRKGVLKARIWVWWNPLEEGGGMREGGSLVSVMDGVVEGNNRVLGGTFWKSFGIDDEPVGSIYK